MILKDNDIEKALYKLKEDLGYTIKAYAEILPRLKIAIENNQVESLLKGELLEAVFRKINEHNIQPKNA